MKNMKQFIFGVIIGGTIFGTIGVSATEYIIKQNTYPIIVNGTQQPVDALNVNDFTYVKIRDVSKALGGIVGVNFDEVNEAIKIDSINSVSSNVYTTPIPTATPNITPSSASTVNTTVSSINTTSLSTVTNNNGKEESSVNTVNMIEKDNLKLTIIDSIEYIQLSDIPKNKKFIFMDYDEINNILTIKNSKGELITLEHILYEDKIYFKYDYYKTTVNNFLY